MLRITIKHDSDVSAPWKDCDGMWRVISNDSRDGELYEEKESFFTLGFRRKLRVGLAFPLSKYEHGGVEWSLAGEGTNCRWDTTRNAGFLVWDHKPGDMGAKSYEDRKEDAKRFLEIFNDWVNGNCYGYKVERVGQCSCCGSKVVEEELDSCWGFIGADHVFEQLRDVMASPSLREEYEYEFAGDGADLAAYYKVR
jgi:hypothetical protein